jgi:hypothetical protein
VLHRAVEHVAHLDSLQLRVGAADLIGDGPAVLAVARTDGLVQGQGHIGRAHFNRLGHVVRRYAQPLGQL